MTSSKMGGAIRGLVHLRAGGRLLLSAILLGRRLPVRRGAAKRIVGAYDARQAAKRPVVRVEDAFVGILARESGVHPIDISELVQDPPAGRKQEPSTFAGQLLVHRVHDFEKAFEWITFPVKTSFERGRRKGSKKKKRRRLSRV